MQNPNVIYVLTSAAVEEDEVRGHAARIDADRQSRVLFREEVDRNVFRNGVERALRSARNVLEAAATVLSGYEVDKLTLRLVIDAKVGCAFVADAFVQASIEIQIRRVS